MRSASSATSRAASGLSARAGVATGETAVTIGAEGQGLVAGDLVNTASRVQSAAEPGTVFGRRTRRGERREAAIVYEELGEHELRARPSRSRCRAPSA